MLDPFERGATLVERYQLKGRIGDGGMGDVFLARDLILSRDVAIKRIKIDPDMSDEKRPMFLRRFRHEATAIAKLRHPNIVTVHDVQQVGGHPFIVMEFFKGGVSLIKWGNTVKPTIAQWLRIAKQIFSALHHAHSRGILHRDIKSGNVLARGSLDSDDAEVLVIDWGIALSEGTSRVTEIGNIVGTPGAMDPEVIKGGQWSHQSDFYAMGVLLYQAFCGAKPHHIPDHTPSFNVHRIYERNEIIPPHKVNPAIDGDLQTFLVRLLATAPSERPTSARAAIAMIESIERGEDVDFDRIAAAHPTTALLVDEEDLEELPLLPDHEDARGTKPLNRPTPKSNDSVAEAILNEFDNAEAAAPMSASAPRKDKTPSSVRMPLTDLSDGLSVEQARAPAASPAQPQAKSETAEVRARLAELRGQPAEGAGEQPRRRNRAIVVGGALAAMLTIGWVVTQRSSSSASLPQPTSMPVPIRAVDPSELQLRPQQPTGLEQITTAPQQQQQQQQQASLNADTRANYNASNDSIGGSVPPPAALRAHSGGSSATKKDEIQIDRSMTPAALTPAAAQAQNGAASGSDFLAVRYGTRVQVTLLELLDTSSGEPVRAQLLSSLPVDASKSIPAGSVFFGRATLRRVGDTIKTAARFERVQYPNGEQHRIIAVAVNADGNEALPNGTIEMGDAEEVNTGAVAGDIAKNAALDGVSAVPGASALSGTLRSVIDGTSQAVGKSGQKPRKKTRLMLPRGQMIPLQFLSPANIH